jgi:3-phenylpropionate/trans-cinnamate dioxygenase ferredoxin subunit
MEWIRVFSSVEEAHQRLKENTPQLVVIGDVSICLVKRQNNFFAIENKCSHNGESLSKGVVNFLGEVICPWHGYRFDLKTGRESAERSRDLVIYPIKQNEEGFFIAL